MVITKVGTLKLKTIIELVFILAIIIKKEVSKTKTSFLAFGIMDTWRRNSFFDHSSSRSLGLSFS